MGIGPLVLSACSSSDSDSTTTTAKKSEGILFVQTAEKATFARDGKSVKITLSDTSSITTTFTESPERSASEIPTVEFVRTFNSRFPKDKPNATVSSTQSGVGEFVVELSDPKLPSDRTLVYTARLISSSDELPKSTGPVSLFIDPGGLGSPPRLKTISGTVKDDSGEGVSGATVDLILTNKECGWDTCSEVTSGVYVTTTDANGSFSNSAPYNIEANPYTFRASAPNYASSTENVDVGEDGGVLNFTLSRSP